MINVQMDINQIDLDVDQKYASTGEDADATVGKSRWLGESVGGKKRGPRAGLIYSPNLNSDTKRHPIFS